MSPKDDQAVEASADITNPRDVQGILALLFSAGFLAIAAFALTKAGSIADVLSVVNLVVPLASLIIGFYFGKKAAE
jgi:hypothetical protein